MAVLTRAGFVPAAAALTLLGAIAAHGETAPAGATATPPATAGVNPEPPLAKATPAAAATATTPPEAQAKAAAEAAASKPEGAQANKTPAASAGVNPEPPLAKATPAAATTAAPADKKPDTASTAPGAGSEKPAASIDHKPLDATAKVAEPGGQAPATTAALPDAPASPPVTAVADQALPPADAIVAGIRQKLADGANKANDDEAVALSSYYEELHGPAIWVSTSGITPKAKGVIEEIGKAEDWGLPAADFDVPHLAAGEITTDVAVDAEIKLARAVLKYARYARGGRINPASISQLMDQAPSLRAPKVVLTEIAAAEAPDAYLRSLHPKHEQFERLRQALLKMRGPTEKVEEEPAEDPALSVKLPPAGIIRPGAEDQQIALLRQRLKMPAEDKAKENVYDPKLQEAVREFQKTNGLRADGVIGNGTRNVLNGSKPKPPPATSESKIERILINMERWRWLPEDLGQLYVWDNVPEFLTRVVKNDKVIHTDEIIVGQPSWPTPVFSADMKTVVFRPSWGVPDGIKSKELAPLLRKSSGAGFFGIFGGGYSAQAVLDAYDLRAYANGRLVDANSVDWSSVDIRRFSFQQPPGPKNVLGDVKFMFPNSHDVYMHDTPERNLFGKSFRALSHGCMRVHEPRRLAEILLGEDKGWSAEKVQSMFNSGGDVALDKHIPVHVTYFTARVDDNGKVQTFGDFYGLDGRTSAALTGKGMRFEQPSYPEDDVVAASDDPTDGPPMQQQGRRAKKKQYQGPATLSEAISGLFAP